MAELVDARDLKSPSGKVIEAGNNYEIWKQGTLILKQLNIFRESQVVRQQFDKSFLVHYRNSPSSVFSPLTIPVVNDSK